jgi:hypothetical protein
MRGGALALHPDRGRHASIGDGVGRGGGDEVVALDDQGGDEERVGRDDMHAVGRLVGALRVPVGCGRRWDGMGWEEVW